MKPPRELTDEEAADFALSLSQFERKVIALCSRERSWCYPEIARKIGATYDAVQAVGHKLRALRLAHISVIPYNGSAIFLNVSGEGVKRAVEALAKVEANRAALSKE